MSDLFTPLRDFRPEVDPLAPEDVRRLGTRRHRRRVAATLGATACLVVGAVVAGVSASSIATDATTPLPADRPTQGATLEAEETAVIPTDFPLGRGLPTASQQLDMRGADTPPTGESVGTICGEPYALTGRPVDRAAIEGTNQEYLGVRDLAVYRSSPEAVDAARTLASRLQACPLERSSGGDTATTVAPLADLGDHAWLSVRTLEYDGDVMSAEYYLIVQRGSATLVLHQQGGERALLREGARQAYLDDFRSDTVEPMVAALCGLDGVC